MKYDCKQATLLSIKKEEGKITAVETLKLQYHLLLCDPCRRFIDQWNNLNGMRKKSIKTAESASFKLSDDSRERIQKKLSSL